VRYIFFAVVINVIYLMTIFLRENKEKKRFFSEYMIDTLKKNSLIFAFNVKSVIQATIQRIMF
jgi:hypothetical protein